MSSGHTSFDHSVQEANLWLKAIATQLHFEERRFAYSALRAVLHALRDRLQPQSAVHLGAQLPMVIRGLYYEGWRLTDKPSADHSIDEFCTTVTKELPPSFPMDPGTLSRGVFQVVFDHLDPGETAKVIDQLPISLRGLWPEVARRGS
jgi:uncharacterized protein (DUF2267 family)